MIIHHETYTVTPDDQLYETLRLWFIHNNYQIDQSESRYVVFSKTKYLDTKKGKEE